MHHCTYSALMTAYCVGLHVVLIHTLASMPSALRLALTGGGLRNISKNVKYHGMVTCIQ
jgi:hypothetical protein